MAQNAPDAGTPRKPLRAWPGVVAVVVLFAARFGVKAVVPGFAGFAQGMQWAIGASVAVVLWWLLLSRARWFERLGGLVILAGGLFAAWQLRHPSMGPLWLVGYAVPFACLALVVAAVVARRLPDGARRTTMAAAVVLACLAWTLVRTEGITGDHVGVFHWRWTMSPEERLLAQLPSEPAPPAAPPAAEPPPAPEASPSLEGASEGAPAPARPRTEPSAEKPAAAAASVPAPATAAAPSTAADWPGFRGPGRDGRVAGVRIATDWAATPPVELWRRAVGPGWSSFAVHGHAVYTQEQRGDEEVVASYDLATGRPLWTHADPARFFESNAGPGPRGTPAVSDSRVYALGATGILNALAAEDGSLLWSRDAASDGQATPSMAGGTKRVPDWGFSSSPLVVGDVVIVALAGQLVGYDRASGEPRWTGPAGGVSYSSPQRVTVDGVEQVLLMSAAGATSLAPATGEPLWQHAWRGFPIVQPAAIPDGDLLVVAHGASGVRRLAVEHGPGGWSASERWTSPGLKPYFNDFVAHEGHAYGFDGRILACIDLADGARKWKGGRFGNGQLILLPEQDLLLILSEEGELALVAASPERFNELAHFDAIEGKTWNHPALVGDTLLVRNGAEMAAFRLAPAGDGEARVVARRSE